MAARFTAGVADASPTGSSAPGAVAATARTEQQLSNINHRNIACSYSPPYDTRGEAHHKQAKTFQAFQSLREVEPGFSR
jgi:hypothetical protein